MGPDIKAASDAILTKRGPLEQESESCLLACVQLQLSGQKERIASPAGIWLRHLLTSGHS